MTATTLAPSIENGQEDPMDVLRSTLLFTLNLVPGMARKQDFGITSYGHRYAVPIDGGRFEGPRLRGTVLSDGLEQAWKRPDGTKEFEIQFTLKTDDDALIRMHYRGLTRAMPEISARLDVREELPFDAYYIRTTPRFETSAPNYLWMNSIIAVAQTRKMLIGPIHKVFEIL
jgi:hypothetical protein